VGPGREQIIWTDAGLRTNLGDIALQTQSAG
jgi:hypothetical protein